MFKNTSQEDLLILLSFQNYKLTHVDKLCHHFLLYLTPSFQTPLHFCYLVQTILAWNTSIPWVLCSEVIFLCSDSWMLPGGVPTWWVTTPVFKSLKWVPIPHFNLDFQSQISCISRSSRTVRMYSFPKETEILRVLEELCPSSHHFWSCSIFPFRACEFLAMILKF